MLPLNEQVGFNPNLSPFKALYDEGHLALVQGVGYPNPNRSHFRSTDIWTSARPDILERTGWLGRYLDANAPARIARSKRSMSPTPSRASSGPGRVSSRR